MWKEAWWYARARTNPDRPCHAVRLHPPRRTIFPPPFAPPAIPLSSILPPFSRRAGGKPPPRAAQRKPLPPFPQPHAPFFAARAASPAPKPRCLDLDRTTQAASPSRLFPALSPPRGHRAPVAWEKWGGRRKAYARSASFYPIAPVDHAAGPWFFHSRRHTDLSGRDFPRPRPLFRILVYPPSLLKARQTGNLSLAKVSNCGYNWVKQVESAFLFILQVRSVLWL